MKPPATRPRWLTRLGGPLAALVATTLVLFPGCATRVAVEPSNLPARASKGVVSPATLPWWRDDPLHQEVLLRRGLAGLMRQDPDRALDYLRLAVALDARLDETVALAELSCRYAHRLERIRPERSLGFYVGAAALTFPRLGRGRGPASADPQDLRLVQAYNHAVAGVVLLLQTLPGGLRTNHVVTAAESSFLIEVRPGDPVSDPLQYDEWRSADDWKESGLAHRYRNDGLGARLIGIREPRPALPLELHLPDEGVIQPSTAVLRFPPSDNGAPDTTRTATLVFYNPIFTPAASFEGKNWPLAADFTMPWATLLARTRPLLNTRWSAMVRPGQTSRPHRLYLMEPYAPDRIPLIMVHGLHSTPLAWEQMTNELIGDPAIRARFQIWHYLYPTGLPFLTSAANFRDDLEEMRRLLDPAGHDFVTRNIILLGHSMGGLIARTLVTDSGDVLWNSTFAMASSAIDPGMKQLPELRRMFYFQPKSYVKRVIFIAVPHHGTKSARSVYARLIESRMRLPDDLNEFIFSAQKSTPGLFKAGAAPLFDRGYPNSIRVLSPSTEGLVALAGLPCAPGIPFHSIMGDRGRGGGLRSSDGFVPYASSHLAGAASELVVPAGHHAQENPQAIAEVKRILQLHLAGLEWSEFF